jgi:aminobenzoyl-glutamate utilization protein A
MNLNAIPRHNAGATRINVGTLHAGSGRNVIADTAVMELEIRGANTEINNYMTDYAKRILEAAAQMHGCTCEIKLMGAAEALKSDKVLADRIEKVCNDLSVPVTSTVPGGGSEDYSYMMNRVQAQGGQAVFFRTVCPITGGAHNVRYDFTEDVMVTGVKVFCGAAADLLK